MHLRTDENRIRREISQLSRRMLETRQVAQRLRRLLPDRLREVESSLRKKHTAGRAKRMALASEDYESHLNEVARITTEAHELRVRIDILYLTIYARQSINSFERQRLLARKVEGRAAKNGIPESPGNSLGAKP